jgi:hypothetical protein
METRNDKIKRQWKVNMITIEEWKKEEEESEEQLTLVDDQPQKVLDHWIQR